MPSHRIARRAPTRAPSYPPHPYPRPLRSSRRLNPHAPLRPQIPIPSGRPHRRPLARSPAPARRCRPPLAAATGGSRSGFRRTWSSPAAPARSTSGCERIGWQL
uniref:Uncharacterized protein n=1 Tax=Arundo donax TaxID=35708 RepID=A0A0A9EY20_ARUDO